VLLPALFGSVLIWNAALAAAPYALSQRAGGGALTGATAVYLAASFICHQRADRSFHPWGMKLPVCGRCAGLYAGALLGLLAVVCCARVRATRVLLVAAAIPTGATLVLEVLGVFDPGNPGRAAAAVPLGAAVCWFVAGAIRGKVH
jgi:uncharacterized membrane protein